MSYSYEHTEEERATAEKMYEKWSTPPAYEFAAVKCWAKKLGWSLVEVQTYALVHDDHVSVSGDLEFILRQLEQRAVEAKHIMAVRAGPQPQSIETKAEEASVPPTGADIDALVAAMRPPLVVPSPEEQLWLKNNCEIPSFCELGNGWVTRSKLEEVVSTYPDEDHWVVKIDPDTGARSITSARYWLETA
jgi:hypothetical protein